MQNRATWIYSQMMPLKCVICGRQLDKAEFFIGGHPVGSTCAKNRGLTNTHSRVKNDVVRNDQLDLFGEEMEIKIKVKRELFSFSSEQDWANRAKRMYGSCGVQKGFYITVDAKDHIMHRGECFMSAEKSGAFPVTVYELETNWTKK